MTHFEVLCPECTGGLTREDCPFKCSARKVFGQAPIIEKVEGLLFYFRCTCVSCGAREECEFAYDWYNTDGDCLQEK